MNRAPRNRGRIPKPPGMVERATRTIVKNWFDQNKRKIAALGVITALLGTGYFLKKNQRPRFQIDMNDSPFKKEEEEEEEKYSD